MFDYIYCKSVDYLVLCQYVFRKEVPCQYFHSGFGGRIPVLKNIQKITNARECIKSVSFKAMQFLPLIYHISLTTLL